MPYALKNTDLDFSGFAAAKEVITAEGSYAAFGPMFVDSGLNKLILPEKMDFTNKVDTDYGSQKRFSWQDTNITKSAADAAFNSKDVVSLAGVEADLYFDAGSVSSLTSYSLMMVLMFATGSKSIAFQQFCSVIIPGSGSGTTLDIRWDTSGNQLSVNPNSQASSNTHQLAGASVPAELTPFLFAIDYNHATTTSHIFINSPTALATKANHNAQAFPSLGAYGWSPWGRAAGLAAGIGFKGKAGLFHVRNGIWDTTTRTNLFTMVKNYYGIAG